MSLQLLRTGPRPGFNIRMSGKQSVEYLLTPMAKPDPIDEKNIYTGSKAFTVLNEFDYGKVD